ncbi:MAG: tol-pal system protein YbgF [Gammaproteobacteria bacterium]|nr:tol-pal system protein YbgF [Gammaproteobacteria bacterium]
MALQRGVWLLIALMLAGVTTQALGRDDPSLVQRVERMERMLDSRSMLDLLNRLEQLQREVQQLRGEQEVQGHTLNGLQQRQREQYLDIDRRLHRLEAGGAAPDVSGSPGATELPKPLDTGVAPAAGVPKDVATADPGKERERYEHALDVLKEGRYEEAAKAFRDFLANYPDSRYGANARYWLGEAHYVVRDFDTAEREFTEVVERFPQDPKVADARLKLGFIHYERQEWGKARETLQAVVDQHPGSTAARLAQDRLARMGQEGR